MAEIALAAVIQKSIDILGNLLVEEGTRFYWLREHILWIEAEMRRIQSFLKDADAKKTESQLVANWVREVRDLAYDVEDVMETFLHRLIRKGQLSERLTWFYQFGSSVNKFVMEIEVIKRRVEDLNHGCRNYGIVEISGSGGAKEEWNQRRSFPHVDEVNVVGFEKHIEEMVTKMIDESVSFCVVSIVGMPGLGKTTLAKKVFNSVKRNFECSAWVYVSQEPRVRDLVQDIARQVGLGKEKHDENIEANLFEFLKNQRYVIVLDDIWKISAWDALKNVIPHDCKKGSRLLLTSRIRDVGAYASGDYCLHSLKPLTPDLSWQLFSKIMFSARETDGATCTKELKELGGQIVKRCGGVPLAIVVTAGQLLQRERTEPAWRALLKKMGQEQGLVSGILALSYAELPSYLKPCFLYFSLFPEDHEISVSELVNLWVAEGFIQANGEQTLEDAGEDYLNELINRNLIQVSRRRYDERIQTCRIHDLLHNLCISIAKEINFLTSLKDVDSLSAMRVRRVAIYNNSNNHDFSDHQTPKLRSLLFFNKGDDDGLKRRRYKRMDKRFRLLRVLSLEGEETFSQTLTDEICNLIHLRYLKLRGPNLQRLPSTISNLQNLQTLDARECKYLILPTSIWKMKQLRHILLYGKATFKHPVKLGNFMDRFQPVDEVCLPNLQTLSMVHGGCLKAACLREFKNIKKLGIRYSIRRFGEVLTGATPISEKLESLKLDGLYYPYNVRRIHNHFGHRPVNPALDLSKYRYLCKLYLKGTLQRLPNPNEFPPNLTKLTLLSTFLKQDPMETLKQLPRLKILKLGFDSYNGRKMVSYGASGFPLLQVLELADLPYLEELEVEEGGMPRLEQLRIYECHKLKKLLYGLRSIRTELKRKVEHGK